LLLDLIGTTKKGADKYLNQYKKPPIGEPERELASYKRRETSLKKTFV